MNYYDQENKFSRGLIVVMLLVVVSFLAIAGIAYYLMVYQKEGEINLLSDKLFSGAGVAATTEVTEPSPIPSPTPTPTPSPTSFPFKEMTIPGLRERQYNSQLGELQKLADKANFASYLTNYDSDGFKVNGYITIPHGQIPEGGWPAVVFVHGYIPPQEYETTKNYISYADALSDSGLVVFKIDLRGHDESEGEAYGAYFSESYVVDTLNAYRALQSADFVNADQVGLWGHSMAGNVVFRSKVAMIEIPKVVIWAGAVYTYEDMAEYRIQDNSYQPPPDDSERRRRREELFGTHGNFDPSSEFWSQVAPTNYLDEITGDFQVHHAANDNVVRVEYSRNLKKILEDNNINIELFEYQSGGHNLTGSNFTTAMNRSSDFLTNY